MNIALLLKIVFQRKSWIIATSLVAAVAAVWILVNAEPLYVSGSKLWIRESAENSSLLRIERTGAASDTHIQVQEQVIRSNRVMDGALVRGDLAKPVASRSILSRYKKPSEAPPAPKRLDALKALASSVNVSIVNPEVLIVSATMNDPELAQRAVQSVIDEFQEVSLEIAVDAIDRHQEYLEKQRSERDAKLREQQDALQRFEERHPEVTSAPGDSAGLTGTGGGIQSPTFAKSTTDVGPVPLISRQLAELELKRNRLAATLDPKSYEMKKLNLEIEQGKALLDTYLASLAQQGKMQLEYDTMNWELEQRRTSTAELLKEIQQLDVSRGSRIAEQSGITVLDPPSFDPEKIHPKKKATLMAALVLGTIAGGGLALLAHLLDPRIRYAEALETSLKVPVLADLPYKKPTRAERKAAKAKAGA